MELIGIFSVLLILVTLFLMGKRDFDNLNKVIQVGIILNTTTLASVEIDFELPRGYIAKLWRVDIEWVNIQEDTEGNIQWVFGVSGALIRDPDDAFTIAVPDNQTQHDVVTMFLFGSLADDNGATELATIWVTQQKKTVVFPEHIDVVTARNMRFNIQGGGTNASLLTESAIRCEIHYTLEKVTDADILELLDIL